MKKHFLSVFIAVFSLTISYLYAAERDLGTPAKRLVGNWSTESGDNLYYANIGTDGFGSFVLVQPNGRTAHHRYTLLKQISNGRKVNVQLRFSDGSKRNETYLVEKNGNKLTSKTKILGMFVTTELKYVDR